MSKQLVLTMNSWLVIRRAIAEEYPPSVLLLREKMKSVLGFTPREHEEWFDHDVTIRDVSYGTRYRAISIHLDFYNEPKRTMFLLKYGDFIHNSDQNP